MTPDPRGYPAGIIFRRLDADLDRRQAARLLPDCALDDHDGACVWYGLCDLTAAETSGPVGPARRTRPQRAARARRRAARRGSASRRRR